MAQIRLDADLAVRLQGVGGIVELCDPNGNVVGKFLPSIIPAGWEPISPDISPEELERRINSQEKRYTTQEMLSRLEKF